MQRENLSRSDRSSRSQHSYTQSRKLKCIKTPSKSLNLMKFRLPCKIVKNSIQNLDEAQPTSLMLHKRSMLILSKISHFLSNSTSLKSPFKKNPKAQNKKSKLKFSQLRKRKFQKLQHHYLNNISSFASHAQLLIKQAQSLIE